MKNKFLPLAIVAALCFNTFPAVSHAEEPEIDQKLVKFQAQVSRLIKKKAFKEKAIETISANFDALNDGKYEDFYNAIAPNHRDRMATDYGIETLEDFEDLYGSGALDVNVDFDAGSVKFDTPSSSNYGKFGDLYLVSLQLNSDDFIKCKCGSVTTVKTSELTYPNKSIPYMPGYVLFGSDGKFYTSMYGLPIHFVRWIKIGKSMNFSIVEQFANSNKTVLVAQNNTKKLIFGSIYLYDGYSNLLSRAHVGGGLNGSVYFSAAFDGKLKIGDNYIISTKENYKKYPDQYAQFTY